MTDLTELVEAVNTRTGKVQEVPPSWVNNPNIFNGRFQPLSDEPENAEAAEEEAQAPGEDKPASGAKLNSRRTAAVPAENAPGVPAEANENEPGEAGENHKE